MAIHYTETHSGGDLQEFEYDKTLALLIPEDQRHLNRGDAVVFNKDTAFVGLLVTEIAPAEEAQYTRASVYGRPTYGLNVAPGYASVRIRGGVFKLDVTLNAAAKVGDAVYVTAGTGTTKPKLTLAKTGADAILGYVVAPSKATTGTEALKVLLKPGTVA